VRTEDVRDFLQTRPFRPFRITLTDGRTYSVQHPELAMVGRSTVAIGLPRPNDPEPVYDRLVTVSLSHIVELERLESSAPPAALVRATYQRWQATRLLDRLSTDLHVQLASEPRPEP